MLPFDPERPQHALRPTIIWHPDYEMNIGRHVFPTEKFRLTKELLVQQGLITEDQVLLSPKATDKQLLSVLTPSYLSSLRTYKHNNQTRNSEGFCYLNDLAIAIQVLLNEGLVERIAVVDLDVHQGNGTAATFAGESRVFTLSIHEEDLYPRQKETSDRDIALDRDITPEAYLEQVKIGLEAVVNFGPELVVYAAGVDIFQDDKLGHLNLPWTTLRQRDELVLESTAKRGIPFFTVVAGGYARELKDTIGLHAQTVEVAFQVCQKYQTELSKGREKSSAA